MATVNKERRRFIATLAATVAALVAGWRFLVPARLGDRERFVVAAADIPPQGALVYRERRLALVRAGQELYALDLACTHLGCTVTVTQDKVVCPCHGSIFDHQGRVLQGPATRPLNRYPVEERDGQVVVLL